jgi:GR25 family glycosyltransferase involved in LPS biosynthesis
MSVFKKAMIVYEPNAKRLNNYYELHKIIPDLTLFPARDSVNNYEHFKQYGFDSNYHTQKYVKEYEHCKGKIGCNISHIELLKDFLTWDTDWLLVLEDDISLNGYTDEWITDIITVANKNNSNYVHLYTNPRYYEAQKHVMPIAPNIYPMIYQWGGVAYLINKKGITTLMDLLPYSDNFDNILSLYISNLNSLCCLNTVFNTEGSLNSTDTNSKFGSLIWNL